jgi:hypothetical protein
MKNIILIGNGFDLAHNIHTSYNHFITHLTEKAESTGQKSLISNLGPVNNNHTLSNNSSNRAYVKKNDTQKYIISSQNLLLIKICKEIDSQNWCDIEKLYFEELKIRTNQNIKTLHKEFREIKNELEIYLSKLEKSDAIDSFKLFFENIHSIGKTLCINFNYTSTYKELYSSAKIELMDIHGTLNQKQNPIIFGYAATEEENNMLLENGNNEYLKNIKTYHYNRTPIERTLSEYLNHNDELNIYIIGHSCGVADINILHRILSHEKIRTIEIFYHNDYDSYFDSLINVRRILMDSNNFDKVTNFESSFRCPQYYDMVSEIHEGNFQETLRNEITACQIAEHDKAQNLR